MPPAQRRADHYLHRVVPAPRVPSPEHKEESEDPLNIVPDSADLPANQHTKLYFKDKFNNNLFEANPVAIATQLASESEF